VGEGIDWDELHRTVLGHDIIEILQNFIPYSPLVPFGLPLANVALIPGIDINPFKLPICSRQFMRFSAFIRNSLISVPYFPLIPGAQT